PVVGRRGLEERRQLIGGTVLDLNGLDLDDIAMALADQTDYGHRWLIDPTTGQLLLWTSDTGIDGEHPVDLQDLDLIPIDPIPSDVWYQDMVDFADGISDARTGQRLTRTLQGRGAFRRFKNQLYRRPDLAPWWQALRNARARRRAIQWLLDQHLITQEAA